MNELLNILEEQEIKSMIEINHDIKDLNEDEIKDLLSILTVIECNERQIRNIITCNPFYFSRSTKDIISLINKLQYLGITKLNITFDSNPYLLNKDAYEIDEFIEEKRKENMDLEDIIDLIDSGMLD